MKKKHYKVGEKTNLSNKAQIEIADQTIAKEISVCLEKHYPSHIWAVNASVEQGVVNILNLNLSGEYGFSINMDDLMTDPAMKIVVIGCGELLERYNVTRGKLNTDEINTLKIDFKGDPIPIELIDPIKIC